MVDNPRGAGGLHRDWGALRDEYVTGATSLRRLARERGVPYGSLQKAARRSQNGSKNWVELRADFRSRVSAKALDVAGESLAVKRARAAHLAVDVAISALERLRVRLQTGNPIEDRDLIAVARLGMIDRIEMTGDPFGAPISVAQRLDELSLTELQRLAAS